jgi:hypothetical protein
VASILLFFINRLARACGKIVGDIRELERLFSVYKVEGNSKILLGGLVERRKSRRSKSNRAGLMEMAKRKFAESPDEDIKIFLREEK